MLPIAVAAVILYFMFYNVLYKKAKSSAAMTDAKAVNTAGSLRMLTQRCMKCHLMVGANLNPDSALSQLEAAIKLFDKRLELLKKYAPSEEIKYLTRRVEQEWAAHRVRLMGTPDKRKAISLLRENNDLLEMCDDLVNGIAHASHKKLTGLVNMAGRQRMLSQRIAKNCVAIHWGLGSDDVHQEFRSAIKMFDESMDSLMSSRFNSPRVALALEQASNRWKSYRPQCNAACSGSCIPQNVYQITDAVLEKMDNITGMYEEIADS